MEYRHFLITRLNVFYKQKMPQHGYDPEEWLLGRMRIFKEFCFPSVVNQTASNFDWILYIDSRTPVEVSNELTQLFLPFKNFHLIEKEFSDFAIYSYLDNDIRKIVGGMFDYLISTRLDTDDMIHKEFLTNIQSIFEKADYLPVNFNKGYVYDIYSGVTAKVNHQYNPFMTLISKVYESAELKTIFHRMHHEFQNDRSVKRVDTKEPMWCMTINEYNYSTGFFGKVLFKRSSGFVDFFSVKRVIDPSFFAIITAKVDYYLRILGKIKSRLSRTR